MEKGSGAPPRGASGIRILEESVRRRDAEALQFVMQRSAFQTQESCGATSSTNLQFVFVHTARTSRLILSWRLSAQDSDSSFGTIWGGQRSKVVLRATWTASSDQKLPG